MSKVPRNDLDIEKVKANFILEDGKLVRTVNYYNKSVYEIIPTIIKNNRYFKVGLNGKEYMYHRFVWILSKGEDIPAGMYIDHIDGNRYNNRIENLRIVSNRQNTQNKSIHREGKLVGSGFGYNRYVSRIRFKDKTLTIGYFLTEKEANKAYAFAEANEDTYYIIGSKAFKKFVLTSLHANRKVKGYCYAKRTNTYNAYVKIDGKRIYTGKYKQEGEAVSASLFAANNINLYKSATQFRELVKTHVGSSDNTLHLYYYSEDTQEYIVYTHISSSRLEVGRSKDKIAAENISRVTEILKSKYDNPEQFVALVKDSIKYL